MNRKTGDAGTDLPRLSRNTGLKQITVYWQVGGGFPLVSHRYSLITPVWLHLKLSSLISDIRFLLMLIVKQG